MTNCWIKLLKRVNIINYKKKKEKKENCEENPNFGIEPPTTPYR